MAWVMEVRWRLDYLWDYVVLGCAVGLGVATVPAVTVIEGFCK